MTLTRVPSGLITWDCGLARLAQTFLFNVCDLPETPAALDVE